MKIGTIVLLVLLSSSICGWVVTGLSYRADSRKNEKEVSSLQVLLSKCKSNNVTFDKKVKKSDLGLQQFFNTQDTCAIDTLAIVEGYFVGKKRKDVIRFWRKIKD